MPHDFSLGVLDVGVLRNSLELAPRLEEAGFSRYWVSEHHGENAIPTPVIALTLLGGLTSNIRIGLAGVLLRFHSPLAVAQSFRTLQWIFNGRVDLGVARASVHSEVFEASLLDGRVKEYSAEDHDRKVELVQSLVTGRVPKGHPLSGQEIEPPLVDELGPPPLWVLSSSVNSARFAARIGARYSFHDYYGRKGAEAIAAYRASFVPSPELPQPEWNVCIDAFVADTESDARAIRDRPIYDDKQNKFFAGSPSQFEKHLASVAEEYQTRNIILSTLRGPSDVEQQFHSLELSMQCAQRLWGTR